MFSFYLCLIYYVFSLFCILANSRNRIFIILCFIAVTLIGSMFIKSLHTESKDTVYKEKTQTTEVVEKQQPTSEKEEFVEEKIDTSKEEIEKNETNSTPSETKQEVKQEENYVNQKDFRFIIPKRDTAAITPL